MKRWNGRSIGAKASPVPFRMPPLPGHAPYLDAKPGESSWDAVRRATLLEDLIEGEVIWMERVR